MTDFNLRNEISELKAHTQLRTKRRYSKRPSLLDPYRNMLIALFEAGATHTELQYWLKKRKVNVALSTVTRYMKYYG
jgi:hypothetical protein